jgi:hypothetical protein
MTIRKVPALPSWLLNRYVSPNQKEALLGDLHEEYQAGRTPAWYWRETLVALCLSIRQHVGGLLVRTGAQFIPVLTAQSICFVWSYILSEQYRQHCATSPAASDGPLIATVCAAVVPIAIAATVWRGPQRRHVRINARAGLLRLSVALLAAIGIGGGALTWAGTASCSRSPSVCSSSAVVNSCQRRSQDAPQGRPSPAHAAH